MKADLVIAIKTQKDLTSWEDGERLLSAVFSEPKLAPQRVATFGEVSSRNGSNVDALDDCRAHWAPKGTTVANGTTSDFTLDFHWVRKKMTKSQGAITFASATKSRERPQFSRINLWAQYRPEVNWAGVFREWCLQTQPYAAILHPLVSQDGPNAGAPRGELWSGVDEVQQKAWSRFLGGSFFTEFRAGDLNSQYSGLTNPGWASWFGGPYAQEVDIAALRSAGFPVEKIGSGYLVQLTAQLGEVASDFGLFSRRRAALKGLFRPKLFMIEGEPDGC
ncbi:hypothetical protein ABEB22_14310 (plasmid) [Thioclava sp. 'Guangxiensis']|uniref:hypothetical protein n=1 Tax=Thioclava sp. 'Guangxiensis' TaxID=3149044 RepID=UPI0032C4748F